jgi:putative flavoprotein involved in K+ transport
MADRIETVVVGGGQAGLAASYCLSQFGREHIILERARLAERWRSERWDSLAFQFPNWALSLPGYAYRAADPDGFAARNEVVRFLEEYGTYIRAPIRLGVSAKAIRYEASDSYPFYLETDHSYWKTRNVVLATGAFQTPSIPDGSASIPRQIAQMHSREYRNPSQLPPGAVLVVGGGTSGAEIAHELHQAGRQVYLSISSYRKAPRRYRGRDIFWWIEELKFWDRPTQPSSPGRLEGVPLLTGLNGGFDVDLRRLSDEGVKLLGRTRGVTDGKLGLASNLEESLIAGEVWFSRFKRIMDDYAEFTGMDLPDEDEPDTSRWNGTRSAVPVVELDLAKKGIGSIVWATGYRYDFGWVRLPVFKDTGEPIQSRGITNIPGLYFLGLRRMHTIKSALLSASGVGADAAYIAQQIATRENFVQRQCAKTAYGS